MSDHAASSGRLRTLRLRRRSGGNAAPNGYDVLDVHHHVGDAFTALGGDLDPAAGMSADEYDRAELESRLSIMDADGVRQAVVIPGHGYLRPDGVADTRRV